MIYRKATFGLVIALASFAVPISAVFAAQNFTICAKPLEIGSLTSAKKKALAHSTRESAAYCGKPYTQCEFKIALNKRNQLLVMVDSYVTTVDGKCTRAAQGFHMDVYAADGTYLHTVPGI